MQRIVIKGEDILCSDCEGHGNILEEVTYGFIRTICPKCKGVGKLDWVSNAMGTPESEDSTSTTDISSNHNYITLANNNKSSIDTISSTTRSITIDADYLKTSAKHIELTDEALESLIDSIEQKLKQRGKKLFVN